MRSASNASSSAVTSMLVLVSGWSASLRLDLIGSCGWAASSVSEGRAVSETVGEETKARLAATLTTRMTFEGRRERR